MEKIKAADWAKLLICILICQSAGVFGSVFTSSSVTTWYPALVKPEFTPPGWVIGIVWITLYTFMGISLFLVVQEGLERPDVKAAVYVFLAQLVVNGLWSYAFFGIRSPLAGLWVIGLLFLLILITILKFWPISRNAAILLLPYILWVGFASYLNFMIWRLNS